MIFEWLRGLTRNKASPCAPAGRRLYAIGDIHGRDDLLTRLLQQIDADSAGFDGERVLIFLGDYVDRGMHSRKVLEFLRSTPFTGYETVFLKGNHDAWLLQALDDPTCIPQWLEVGGLATLLSYGIDVPQHGLPEQRALSIQHNLRANFPEAHREFLAALQLYHCEGDYMFVHAGIRPGLALHEQREEDLCWIRDEFLNDRRDHGFCVVHGHSMSGQIQREHNRIGVDTGAYATGRLSCLVLVGEEQGFLHT